MSPLWHWLIDQLSRMLEPEERDAVMGDLAELGVSDTEAVRDVVGLFVARQVASWKDCRPWLALVGLVVPIGVLLSQISLALSETLSMHLWVYWHLGAHFGTGLTVIQESEALSCQVLAVIAWSWVSGFVLGSLSGRTIYANGSLFYLIWLFSAAALPFRPFAFDSTTLPLLLESLLFLLPSFLGIRHGLRLPILSACNSVLLATAIAALTMLATWTDGWWQTALQVWSQGAWHETVAWQDRMLPFAVVSWPAAYLLALASSRQWRERWSVRVPLSFGCQKTD
jgi:hypothetical protein